MLRTLRTLRRLHRLWARQPARPSRANCPARKTALAPSVLQIGCGECAQAGSAVRSGHDIWDLRVLQSASRDAGRARGRCPIEVAEREQRRTSRDASTLMGAAARPHYVRRARRRSYDFTPCARHRAAQRDIRWRTADSAVRPWRFVCPTPLRCAFAAAQGPRLGRG
jgi:hypothetical protein